MNVPRPAWARDLLVVGAACAVLVPVGLVVANASPAEPPGAGSAAPAHPTAVSPSPDPEDVPRPDPVTVAAVAASFGDRLADGPGRTLYTFSLDGWNDSSCTGRCAEVWQPARSPGGKPQPGAGLGAPMIGSMQRDDGSDQMTFGGRPLYYYSGDGQPGTAAGRNLSSFGGVWTPDAHRPPLPAPRSAGR